MMNTVKRVLTASVLFVLITVLCYMGGTAFLFLICFLSLAVGRELHRLLVPAGLTINRGFLMGCVVATLAAAHAGEEYFLYAFYLTAMAVFVVHIIKGTKDISGYVSEVGMSLVFTVLLGMMTGAAVLLRNIEPSAIVMDTQYALVKNEPGFFLVAMAFLCGAANDSAAYFVGKHMGRNKLVPTISPGKTFEGAGGGIAAAAAAALITNYVFNFPLSVPLTLLFGVVAGFAAITGDLIESAIKRNSNVKDSGTMLPGHGGLFDRFDGIIFVFPAFYLLASLVLG